jgi:hypothetical protein
MKVHIGDYPNNHWSVERFEDWWVSRRHGVDYLFQMDESKYDRLDRLFFTVTDLWQRVLNATINRLLRNRERKISVRIDPHDTWGMDTTLAHIILPMLKQLKATKHGSPWVDDEDVPHLVKKKKRSKKKSEEDQHADTHERWDWVMDEMIWTFEQIVDPDEGRSNYYIPYEAGEEIDRAPFCFTSAETGETMYLWTEEEEREMGRYDPKLHKAYQERINRGLRLFGKYYQGLWD